MEFNGQQMVGLHGATYPFPMNNGLTAEQNQRTCSAIFQMKQHNAQQLCICIGQRKRMNKNDLQKTLLEALYSDQHAIRLYTEVKRMIDDGIVTIEMSHRGGARSQANRSHPYANQNQNGQRQHLGNHHYSMNPPMHNMVPMHPFSNQMVPHMMQGGMKFADRFEMIKLPFYDVVETLLPHMELTGTNHPTNKQTKQLTFYFHLSPEQIAKINYRPESQPVPRFEIQLRLFNITESVVPQKDDFPPNCHVRCDEAPVTLPNIIPTNKPQAEPKRPSRPVNITNCCNRYKKDHSLTIEWLADKRVFAAGVYYVFRVNSEVLYTRLESNASKHRSIASTKNEVIRKLSGGDDDVAMDHLQISLLDPLSKMRMRTPVRCQDCTHLQCFDLMSYLMMNEKKPTWQCPVCSGNCPYDRLIVDDYFSDMLLKVNKNTTEVELKEDGTYDIIKEEDSVCLSDDEDEDKPSGSAGPSTSSAVQENGGKKKPAIEVISLDSDDDEELSRGIQNSLNDNYASDRNAVLGAPTPKTPPPPKNRIECITLDDSPVRGASSSGSASQTSQQQQQNSGAPPSPAVLSPVQSHMNGQPSNVTLQSAMDQIGAQHSAQQRMPITTQPSPLMSTHMSFPSYMNGGQSSGSQTPTSQYGYSPMMQQQYQMQPGLIGRNNQMAMQHQQQPGMMSPTYFGQQMQNGNNLAQHRLYPGTGFQNALRLNQPTANLADNPPPGVTIRSQRRPNPNIK